MIQLTRLNGRAITLNADLIRSAEESPDTLVTMLHGDKVLVRESVGTVTALVGAWRTLLLRGTWPAVAESLSHDSSAADKTRNPAH